MYSVFTVCTVCVQRVFDTYVTHFLLGDASKDGVKLQMFSTCQQLIDGVKLRTVTHLLMDVVDLSEDTAHTSSSISNSAVILVQVLVSYCNL